jgi:hypothetical protein
LTVRISVRLNAWVPKQQKRLLPLRNLLIDAFDNFPQSPLTTEQKAIVEHHKENSLRLPQIPKICEQNQAKAWHLLINRATGLETDESGSVDSDAWHLAMVASKGTAFGNDALRHFLAGLRTVRTKPKGGKKFGPWHLDYSDDSIWASEERLDKFFKKLGRILENAHKTKGKQPFVPDWKRNVDRIDQLVVQGWCERITVDGEYWPPLCCLTIPALLRFLTICRPPVIPNNSADIDAFRQRIHRLGLLSVPTKHRLRYVDRDQHGQFIFA